MAAITAAAIAGGASLVGGIMGNNASAKEAERNRQWQEELSNTAVQRRVKDLKAAGMNPMLGFIGSGAGGTQASTPSGGQAAQHDVVTPAVNSALAAAQNSANLKQTQANTQLSTQDAALRAAQTRSAEAKALEDEAKIPYNAGTAREGYRLLAAQARETNNTADRIAEEVLIKKQERVQNDQLMPLMEQYQKHINNALRLGMSEKEADSQFWEQLEEYGKHAKFGKEMIMIIKGLKEIVGGKSGGITINH